MGSESGIEWPTIAGLSCANKTRRYFECFAELTKEFGGTNGTRVHCCRQYFQVQCARAHVRGCDPMADVGSEVLFIELDEKCGVFDREYFCHWWGWPMMVLIIVMGFLLGFFFAVSFQETRAGIRSNIATISSAIDKKPSSIISLDDKTKKV